MIYQFPSYRKPSCIDNAYSFGSIFTPDECKAIIALGDSLHNEDGQAGGAVNHALRTSRISWIYPNDQGPHPRSTNLHPDSTPPMTGSKIYNRVLDCVQTANEKVWQFNIDGFREAIQYTKYDWNPDAPVAQQAGKFHTHMDLGASNPNRKISVVVQLSDPDDYEGGELRLYRGANPSAARKEQGAAILFPSYMLHEVTPLTAGHRRSLVVWLSGEPFR